MTLPTTYDYTAKDFDALDARLKSLVLSVFPEWPVTASGNAGNLMRELFAYVGDALMFYADNHAREAFWATLRQRKNAIAKSRFVNYTLSGATSATCDVTVTIANGPLPDNLTIPAGSIIRTSAVSDPIQGETQANVTITAGGTTGTLSWEHSETKTATATSTGLTNQKIELGESPYIDDSAVVTTSLGTWTEVDNFLDSDENDLHYQIFVDEDDLATVRFGDGINGAIPTGTISVSYKVGGGVEGNVAAGGLSVIVGSFADDSGNSAVLTVTNATAASGGTDRETVAAARLAAPASLRVLTRAVAREDFEILANRISGVARSLMVTSDEVTMTENTGRLYIVPEGGGTASSALLSAVTTQVTVTYPTMTTFHVDVLTAAYKEIDVVAHVWLSSGANPTTVAAAIETSLELLFEPTISTARTIDGIDYEIGEPNPVVDFGWNYKDEDGNPAGEIAWSDVFNAVRDTVGVRKVGSGDTEFTLNGARDDIQIAHHQFPKLGTVTIINGATGNQI